MATSTAPTQLKSESVDSRSSGRCSCVCSGAALNPQTPLASSERDELLSILSHELRTPVAVALGNLRLLLSGEGGALSPTQHEWTRTAEEYCSRLDQFMTDLVDVCHAGSIEAALDLTPGDLSSAIEKAHGILGPLFTQNGIELEIHTELSGARVHLDETRIAHVFTNLLTNAMAVTEVGGLIRIECVPSDPGSGPFVECRVIDEGPGVPDSDREKIFQAFERGSSPRAAKGRGLGLALCRRIVEAHGGSISISEKTESGSCFVFTLPASWSSVES